MSKLPEFYHVAKADNNLNSDLELSSPPYRIGSPSVADLRNGGAIESDLNHYDSNRFSSHGKKYLNPATTDALVGSGEEGNRYYRTEALAEQIFEIKRMKDFPDKPSRFKCMFGTDSIESARRFNQEYRNGEGEIWKVETDNFLKADMKLVGFTGLRNSLKMAHLYWNGDTIRNDALWEILMEYPIQVRNRVE